MATKETAVEQSVVIVFEGEQSLFQGTVSYADVAMKDLNRKLLPETYGYGLLAEMIKTPVAQFNIADMGEIHALTNHVLRNQKIRESLVEFNQNFCTGLATGLSFVKGNTEYYSISKEDSEAHQEALFATLETAGLIDKYSEILTVQVNHLLKEQKEATTEEASTMTEENVTITLAEYNSLKAIESVNDTNVALMAELNVKVKAYEDLIANLEDMLTEKDELIKSLEENTTNTEEEVNMSEFKITVKSFKEVEVRKTNEDKAVSMDAIDGMDVGAMIKARIKTVDVSKNVNNKIRENAPKAIVKVTNATHTGIDAVAVAAHKTANVIAKATNTTVLKSANAVDAVLDFVAPSTESVELSEMKKAKANAKEGEVFEVNGSSYKLVNGSLIVQ